MVKKRQCDFDWTEEVKNDLGSNEKFSDEDETDYAAMPPIEDRWTDEEDKKASVLGWY